VHDPERVESAVPSTPALGLLPVVTRFAAAKTTVRVRARVTAASPLFAAATGAEIAAYEIHAGRTSAESPSPFTIVERDGGAITATDGAVSAAGTVVGTYLHGLFVNDRLRAALLGALAIRKGIAADPRWGARRADPYERLADAVARAVDLPAVAKLVGLSFSRS